MKTDINPVSLYKRKSGKVEVSKNTGNAAIRYFAVGVLTLLALGIFTSSQEVNAG